MYQMFQKQQYEAAQVSPLTINQQFKMISDGSCDAEDFSVLPHRNKLYLKVY